MIISRLKTNETSEIKCKKINSIDDLLPSDEWYDLRNLVYDKAFIEAEALLSTNPHLRTERNLTGETVLHFLAVENDVEGVKWLAQRDFDLHTETYYGESILDEAISLDYTEFVAWLKAQGVKTGTNKIAETVTFANGMTLTMDEIDEHLDRLGQSGG